MTSTIIHHFPVMVGNVIQRLKQLSFSKKRFIADCNFGFGGHSSQILKHSPLSLIQAYDLDPKVIDYFKNNYQNKFSEQQLKRLTITNANFSSIQTTKIYEKFDIILADFGFNSFHLQTNRGFSWLKDQILDMRYSELGRSCAEIVNQSSQLQIMSILERYGELKGTKQISEAIINERPIKTTAQLKQSIIKCFQEDKTRKIAQVFQAFRIATNNELKDIETLCHSLEKCLQKNGLFIAITFHSLERDVIHRFVREKSKMFSKIQIQNPSKDEINMNSKSKSAKMLSFSKIV